MSTFSSVNIMDGNLVLKERTHRIKIKYSMHQYSIRLHNLGNWLIDGSDCDAPVWSLRVSTTTLVQFQSGLKTILFRLAYGT